MEKTKEIIMAFLRESNWLNLEDEDNAGRCVDIYLKHYGEEQKEESNKRQQTDFSVLCLKPTDKD